MAVLTALALGAGLLSAGAGIYEEAQGSKKTQAGLAQQQAGYQIQQQAAQQQAAISKAQAASSVQFAGQERNINITAANQSSAAATASQGIAHDIFGQQQSLQLLQKQAMETEIRRQDLEQMRGAQRARSISLATGVAQGGSGFVGGSSARGGAYGGISGQVGTNMLGLQQSLTSGEAAYSANQSISQSNLQMTDLQTQYALQQANLQTQKSDLSYSYAQANAGFQTQLADTQTLMAQGQGQVSIGGSMAQAGQMQSQMGASLLSAAPSIFSAGVNMNKLSQGLPGFGSGLSF